MNLAHRLRRQALFTGVLLAISTTSRTLGAQGVISQGVISHGVISHGAVSQRALSEGAIDQRVVAQGQTPVVLGEGVPQPDGRPLPIANASPRHIAVTTPWSVQFARAVMTRNPQTHRRWDYTAGVVLGAIERVGASRGDSAMLTYVRTNIDRFVPSDGSIDGYSREEYNLDARQTLISLFDAIRRHAQTHLAPAEAR